MLNGLDLFSGIGGLAIALRGLVRPRAYCEIDRYCQAVLLSRMADGAIPLAPIWDDVCSLEGGMLPDIDIIYGGFPCQDISVAGLGKGLAGERSGLFFEIERLVGEIRPSFIFLENVPAIRTRGADVVAGRLAGLGYDCRWGVLSAFDVGAPHLRERWWMLAHANSSELWDEQGRRCRTSRERKAIAGDYGEKRSLADATSHDAGRELRDLAQADAEQGLSEESHENKARQLGDGCEALADSDSQGLEVRLEGQAGQCEAPFRGGWWSSEPSVDRVVNGLPHRVDRIKGLGNAVVPAQAREAFMRLMGLKTYERVSDE